MKTQISRDSFRPAAGFSGVYLQQGRMIVDADWNEATDIGKTRLEAALRDAIASGSPRTGGLAIVKPAATVLIRPGALYVEGVPARLDGPAAGLALTAQPDYRNPPVLPASNYRLYADVWERPVSGLEDASQLDAGLHGADTATRTRTMLQVKWCAAGIDPSNAAVNPPIGTAPLALRLRQVVNALDSCDPCAAEVEVDERIGNYLFRVEVHDVFDEAGSRMLVLKWSRDNGAEAYAPTSFPAGFDQGGWAWEFFDADSENLLGHHFPAGQSRRRGVLSNTFTAPGGSAPNAFVRQWDGFAKFNLTTRTLVEGRDRGVVLSGALAGDAHGHVSLTATALSVNLELMELHLGFGSALFLAGDYWQATVREAVDASGDWVLGTSATAGETPRGICHHYLQLAVVDAANNLLVQTDPERRRLNFPPLTDIRAIDVGFTPTCAGLYGTAPNVQAALDALCGIGAEDIGYTLPDCGTAPGAAPTVRTLMASVPNFPNLDLAEKNPSVKDMIDALMCHLNAARLPYDGTAAAVLARWRDLLENPAATAPATAQQAIDTLLLQLDSSDIPHNLSACAGPTAGMVKTLRELIGTAAGSRTLSELIQDLYCKLNATHVPLDKSTLTCADLRTDASVITVQDALDKLCEHAGNGCTVSVPVGQLETRLREFAQASTLTDLSLCLLPGIHVIAENLNITGKRSLRISSASRSASIMSLGTTAFSYTGTEFVLDGIQVTATGNGRLQLAAPHVTATRCTFSRSSTGAAPAPLVRVGTRTQAVDLTWRDNKMTDVWQETISSVNVLIDNGVLGNLEVTTAFQKMFADPFVFTDPQRFDAGLNHVVDMVIAQPLDERIRIADIMGSRISHGTGPSRAAKRTSKVPAAAKSTAPKSAAKAAAPARASAAGIGPARAISNIFKPGTTQPGTGASQFNLRDEMISATVARDNLKEALAAELDFVFLTGFNIALAISSWRGNITLADNWIVSEVLLMNELERAGSGVPAAQVGVDPAVAVRHVAPALVVGVQGAGRLVVHGNLIQRLWSLVPNANVASGRLSGTIGAFSHVAMSGNDLIDYNHSVCAHMALMNGNFMHNAPPNGFMTLMRMFSKRGAITGNTSLFTDEFTHMLVAMDVKSTEGIATALGNLFQVAQFNP